MLGELAAVAAIMGAVSGGPLPCQHAVITENSGQGPTYHVVICSALRPLDDARWELIVDGGPLQNGAVIIGVRVRR